MPAKPVGPVGDQQNALFEIVEEKPKYDVPLGYALLAGAPAPPVIRGDDLEG